MLVLARKPGESIRIGDNIWVTVLEQERDRGDVVRLGIEAPKDVPILREELLYRLDGRREGK